MFWKKKEAPKPALAINLDTNEKAVAFAGAFYAAGFISSEVCHYVKRKKALMKAEEMLSGGKKKKKSKDEEDLSIFQL